MEEQVQAVPASPPPPAQVQEGHQAPGTTCPTSTAGTAVSQPELVLF